MSVFGIRDEDFVRGKVPMTKAEIRALVMVQADIRENDTVLDIGAGTGSITVEAAICAKGGCVYAIERNPEGIRLIQENAKKFNCSNIRTVQGTAPEAMHDVPIADVIIIGGSSGNMHEILNRSEELLREGGRIVVTAVTAETVGETVAEFKNRSFDFEGFQVQVNRFKKLGRYHLFDPISPVCIFTAVKK